MVVIQQNQHQVVEVQQKHIQVAARRHQVLHQVLHQVEHLDQQIIPVTIVQEIQALVLQRKMLDQIDNLKARFQKKIRAFFHLIVYVQQVS